MRRIFLIMQLTNFATATLAQELTIGDSIPALKLETVIMPQAPETLLKNISVDQYKGKVILLDFWATWCGACISAMKKYEVLAEKFPQELQIIAVTHEPAVRIQSFLKNRVSKLTIAIDTQEIFSQFFPYRTIPHVVLIDRKGVIRAITNSEEVTEEVIRSVWNNKSVSLALKKDDTKFDYDEDYFRADSTTIRSFNLQPGIEGVGSFSKIGKGIFAERRVSMHNFTVDALFRMAYQKSYFRMVNELSKERTDYSNLNNRYCLDVIVPIGKKKQLYSYMQSKLLEVFNVEAVFVKRKTPLYVVRRINDSLLLKISKEKNDLYGASSNHFTGNGVEVSSIADFMESFGITGTPVIDETGITGRYDIDMEWEPEKKGSFKEALAKLGLTYEKQEREIELLVLKPTIN